MRLAALLRTKQPKQAKPSDKEGSEPVNVAFLPCEMCYELAVLNRRRDFKARRGCGIIWLDSCITNREFLPVPPQADMTGQQEENQDIQRCPACFFLRCGLPQQGNRAVSCRADRAGG